MIGRNDPCACGSGKKYKKCCLDGRSEQSNDPQELRWKQLRETARNLISKTMDYVQKNYGETAVVEAWEEYHLYDEPPFDPSSPEIATFMPWFFSEWKPDLEDTLTLPGPHQQFTPAEAMLKFRRAYLSFAEQTYLEAVTLYPFSFFEVIRCSPGHGYFLKDILTDETFDVREKMGSTNTREGDILYTKPAPFEDICLLESTGSVVIPPIHREAVMDLRQELQKYEGTRSLRPSSLREFALEIRELYLDLRDELLNPRPPVLTNTDGHLLVPHTLLYSIESPQQAFDQLKVLHLDSTDEELLEDAEWDENGNLKTVTFNWLKKGNKKHKEWNNTILANLSIYETELKVSTNSRQRADLFKKEIKKRKLTSLTLQSTLVEPIDEKIEQAWENRGNPHEEDPKDTIHDSEEEAVLANMNRKHWENWPKSKIPALRNRTPLQASKTKEGRELLRALLLHLEYEVESCPQPGIAPEFFQNLRKKFGCEFVANSSNVESGNSEIIKQNRA